MRECQKCDSLENFKDELLALYSESMIDEIQYKQWVSTDRSTLETLSKPTDEFVEHFGEKLDKLRRHDFIAKQQSYYCTERKESLQDGEVIVTGDFSENYSFVLQDAAQGYHWNNAQATLHPFVAYFRVDGELKHLSYVVISDCLIHDSVAVHLFQKKLVAFLIDKIVFPIKSIIYFSDGAPAQYKNCKNFINLCHHNMDFDGIEAEWHFFATSHGKGPCDGIGGTVKRLAAKASLQRPYSEQIMTARQLFQFAADNISGISFTYCTTQDWEEEDKFLQERFLKARTIEGTQKLHSFIPISPTELMVKTYSRSGKTKEVKVSTASPSLRFEEIKGFVTVKYDDQWYLACVLRVFPDTSEVMIKSLEYGGPRPSYKYPVHDDILTLPSCAVLTTVDPSTDRSGRVYYLTDKEKQDATRCLQQQ